jgi:hypothetical protein
VVQRCGDAFPMGQDRFTVTPIPRLRLDVY